MKKIIEIDFESIDEVSHWLNVLKSQVNTLRKQKDPTFASKNERE